MPIQVPVEGPRTPLPHMGGSDVEVFERLAISRTWPGNLQIMGDWLDVPCSGWPSGGACLCQQKHTLAHSE